VSFPRIPAIILERVILSTTSIIRSFPGVYLPAVMQVLDILREGGDAYEGLRWYRVFDAKCAYFGINTAEPDIWLDAQKLLQAPFSEVHRNAGIYGS
jgi:hypothetical protein